MRAVAVVRVATLSAMLMEVPDSVKQFGKTWAQMIYLHNCNFYTLLHLKTHANPISKAVVTSFASIFFKGDAASL